MPSPSSVIEPGHGLRQIVEAHERARQGRLRSGDLIRSGAAEPWEAAERPLGSGCTDADLAAIRHGLHDGPAPDLAQEYRRFWQAEQSAVRQIEAVLKLHPAWPWMRRVRGLESALVARLVSRLDVTKAGTPSSFWAYCGLATVAAVRYRCPTCGLTGAAPERSPLPRHHLRPGGGSCPDRFILVESGETGSRVAQPRAAPGERPRYDQRAKKTCYLIGLALHRAGGAFQLYYQSERSRFDEARSGWSEQRKHLGALRKTEKLFLAHLWIVWRHALGLPVTQPHARAGEETDRWSDPWEMVAAPRPQSWSRPRTSAPGPLGRV